MPIARRWARIVAVAALLVAAGAPASAQPMKLVINFSIAPQHIQPFIFSTELRERNVFRHWGKSYDVEVVRMGSTGPAIAAVAANRLHFFAAAYQGFANGVLDAKLDLVVIADVLATGRGDNYSPPLLTTKKSGLKTVPDLKGKRIAIISRSSGFDAAMRIQMRKFGMTADKDYTLVEVPAPNMIAGLQQGLFDAAMMVPPFTIRAERSGEFHKVFEFREALGATQTVILVAERGFLARNAAVSRDFIEDYLRGWRHLLDPRNREIFLKVAAAHLKSTPEQLAWIGTKDDEYRDPWSVPDIEILQKNIDDMHKEGFLSGTFKVADRTDLSFIREARRRIEADNK